MASIRVNFNNLSKVATALPVEVGKVVAKGLTDIEAHSKSSAPVDTGNLRNSHQLEIASDQLSGRVYVGAEYAGFVNFGTVKQAAQPYASDAVEKVVPSMQMALNQLEGRIT